MWQVAGEVLPHGVLLAEGNVPGLALLWPYITAHMAFAAQAAADGDNGLLKFGPYSDWLSTEPVSMSFAANFYLVHASGLAAEMASALGRPQEAAAYVALADAKAAAMVAALFSTTTGTWDKGGNMNAQSMALAASLGGAATSGYTAQITAAMVADVAAHTNHPTGGVTSIRWILQGLTAANRSDLALAMALVPTSPSWAYMSTPDMPGTIWESWSGDATHSDGSKNHPMFSGGIGLWLYTSALGLSFRHVASRRVIGDTAADAAADAAVSRRLLSPAESHLGFDPRFFGLSASATSAALDLAAEVRSSATPPTMPALLARAAALGVAASAPPPRLESVCTAAPDAAVVRALGAAEGWREAPAGRCSSRWALDAASGAFELIVSLPSGALGRFSLPLSLLAGAPRVSVRLGGALLLEGIVNAAGGELMTIAARSPALEALPRAASAAEIEGNGRIDFSAGSAKSGLLLEVSAPGEYVLRAERA